jgi:hypothetical protein
MSLTLKQSAALVVSGVVITILGYAAVVLYLTWPISEFSIAKSGTFGDSFGVVTSLFSGLAFSGIILTILLQRQELTESREIFRIQRFEGSFYRLFELYRKNLQEIRITDTQSGTTYHAIDALNFVCKKLNETMQKYSLFLEDEDRRVIYEAQLFVEVQKLIRRQARYLGTLQSLLELIERDLPSDIEREPYWNIVANQLTSHEARYLFYSCLVADKEDPLLNLMHRSGMIGSRLKNNNISGTHKSLYERVHGISIARPSTRLVMPHTPEEIQRVKRLARKKKKAAAAAVRASGAVSQRHPVDGDEEA